MRAELKIATSTGALAIYDPQNLEHRVSGPVDWWADWDEELLEVNAGNVVIVGLQTDGIYDVVAERSPSSCKGTSVSARVRSPSGKLLIVPGEELPGGGLKYGNRLSTGHLLDVLPGVYLITVTSIGRNSLHVTYEPDRSDGCNRFEEQLSLE